MFVKEFLDDLKKRCAKVGDVIKKVNKRLDEPDIQEEEYKFVGDLATALVNVGGQEKLFNQLREEPKKIEKREQHRQAPTQTQSQQKAPSRPTQTPQKDVQPPNIQMMERTRDDDIF